MPLLCLYRIRDGRKEPHIVKTTRTYIAMPQNFFIQRPKVTPTIYAYRLIGVSSQDGYLKIGYTDRDAETRVTEQ